MCGEAMSRSENGSPYQPSTDGPNITLKPISPNPTTLIAKSTVFLMTTLIVFFALIRPASRQLKPACINNTRQEQKSTQTISICSIINGPSKPSLRLIRSVAPASPSLSRRQADPSLLPRHSESRVQHRIKHTVPSFNHPSELHQAARAGLSIRL